MNQHLLRNTVSRSRLGRAPVRLGVAFFLFAMALGQSARANVSACNNFGNQMQNLYNSSVQQGFTTLNQPVVVGCGSTGLTEDQARSQSSSRVQQYASWLASMQLLVSQNSGLASSCSYWHDADDMVNNVGVQQLQV